MRADGPLGHEPGLAQRYPALRGLFAARAAAISAGIARAREDAPPADKAEKGNEKKPAKEPVKEA